MLTAHKHTKVLGNKIDNHSKMLEYSAVTTCVNHASFIHHYYPYFSAIFLTSMRWNTSRNPIYILYQSSDHHILEYIRFLCSYNLLTLI